MQLVNTAEEEEDAEEVRVDAEIDKFIDDVKKTLELYINRMKSDSMRGRSITNDTAVQSLFLQLQHLQPKLMSYIKYKEDARAYYENLQDKLTQLKDAREALNALRHENYEKKRKEMEEKERIRQMQLAQKLQVMRQQKQSYYLYQNQLNLQRLQEQERDLQMRLSQQRELVLQRDTQLFNPSFPGAGYMPPTVSNYPGGQLPGGVVDGGMQYQPPTYASATQPQVGYQQQQWTGVGQQMPPAGVVIPQMQMQPQYIGVNNQQQQQQPVQQQYQQPTDGQFYYNNPSQLNQPQQQPPQFQQQQQIPQQQNIQQPQIQQQQLQQQQQIQQQQYAQSNLNGGQNINGLAEGPLISFD
jgi:growth factor-regulated tyrosine kinase substrate